MNFFYDQSSSISIYHNAYFTFDDVYSILAPLFEDYYGRRKLRSLISNVDHIWCVYDRQLNRYIACALVESHPEDNTLYIQLFGVEKSSQGQGIGTRLLKAIRKWGGKNRYFAILLHTQIDNYQAIGLYEKVGFRKQAHVKNFYVRNLLLSFLEFNEPDAYQMILYL
jgi:ribosomal protein S18 acetylase RimI-like enzyme